jgi:hypothetical protein
MRSVWRLASTGQVVTQPDVSRDVWLPVAPTCSTNSPVRTEWTRMADARTGHPTWTPGTGHRTRGRGTRTGRRTLDGRTLDMRTRTGDQGAVGVRTSWYHDTAGQRTVLLWAAAAHAALGNHDGSAVRPPASARDCLPHCQAAARSLRRRPSGASAHCCPRKRLRVESRVGGSRSSVMARTDCGGGLSAESVAMGLGVAAV